jgi:four helix bundle protein
MILRSMKENNLIQKKSYDFAVRIVKLYQSLAKDKKEYIISKQILRSGTSVGSNIEEAIGAQSDKDFFAKITIAYKEARETHYWIRLLADTDYLNEEVKNDLLSDVNTILRVITKIQKTMKTKLMSQNR